MTTDTLPPHVRDALRRVLDYAMPDEVGTTEFAQYRALSLKECRHKWRKTGW